jgi:putative DNA primase/helicase
MSSLQDNKGDHQPHDVTSVVSKVKKHFADRSGMAPLNQVLTFVTHAYLADLDPDDAPDPTIIEQQLLALVNGVIDAENQKAPRTNMKMSMLKSLTAQQVAQILLRLHRVVKITTAEMDTDTEYDLLAVYQTSGDGEGTYTASEEILRSIARGYNFGLSLNDFKEVVAALREDAERVTRCRHRDLIAVDNGIFHYGTTPLNITIRGKDFYFEPKTLHSFDPAIVFLSKSGVRYVENPEKVVIRHEDGTEWEVCEWVETLSDDPEVVDLIWEIIGAIIRPHVRWNKTAWFYSKSGNNGKGTLCSLMRNLVGSGAHTSIPLSDFGKEFALEPLTRAMSIIVDENSVGTFIDQAANLKAVVTGDVLQINRKHRVPIAFQFFGFMVQCLNEFPRVKDKSESFYRRQLFVPFEKSFTGKERRYIKDDYLERPEVLEYVLWYVLNRAGTSQYKDTEGEGPGCYYTLSEPPATRQVLAEYKQANDPVRAFWDEFRDQFVWDLLPFTFLYDLYKTWFAEVSPKGSPVSRQQFVDALVAIVDGDEVWHCPDKQIKHRPRSMMNDPEPLIIEFDLKDWKNPTYSGTETDKISMPLLKPNYRGLLRS